MDTVPLTESRNGRSRFSIVDLFLVTAAVGSVSVFVEGDSLLRGDSRLVEGDISPLLVGGLVLLCSYGAIASSSWIFRAFLLGICCFLFLSLHLLAWLGCGIAVLAILPRVVPSVTRHLQLLVCWLVAAALSVGCLNHFFPPREVRKLMEAREAYPIEDLSTRLAPLSRSKSSSQVESKSSFSKSSLIGSLIPFYGRASHKHWRIKALRIAHGREYEQFLWRLEFGGAVARHSVSRFDIDLPEITEIGFAVSEQKKEPGQYLLVKVFGEEGLYKFEAPQSLPELLKYNHLDFLNPATFGWEVAPKQVAGFEPHAFRFPVPKVTVKSEVFALRRLELIGLLMSDEPRVYVLEHLPRMDQIVESEVPTRPLNEFESSALQKLMEGEDLVVDEQPDRITMVGALRSFESCAKCHGSRVGELLGAFSYELESVK